MKRKRLDRDAWGFQYFPYYQMRVETEHFKGLAALICMTSGEPQYWECPKAGKVQVCGEGMCWLQMIPDERKHMVTAKYGNKITNGPRVQMKTDGSKKPEAFIEVSKEKTDAVKLPESFDKLKEQSSFYYHGEVISDYELIQTAIALGKMKLPPEDAKNGSVYAWDMPDSSEKR